MADNDDIVKRLYIELKGITNAIVIYCNGGFKEVLGMWVGENESSKYWLMALNELKNIGLEDIIIVSTDNLPGFTQAIEEIYTK